ARSTVTNYGDVPPGVVDGLTFAPDGTLFIAVTGAIARIDGTRSAHPGQLAKIVSLPDPDGVGVGVGSGGRAKFMLVNQNNGTINRVDLQSSPPRITSVFTRGSRGDFVAVGPDGCLYATQ